MALWKMALVAGIEFIHELSNVDPLAKANRDQHWVLHVASSPGVISYLPDADWSHWTTSIMKGAGLCSYWNRYLLWIWIYLFCMQCVCQNYHPWAYGIPYPLQWYFTQTSLLPKELDRPCSWNSLVSPHSPSSWSCWLHKIVEWPLEDSVTVLARWQYFVGLGLCPLGCSISQYPSYGAVSLITRLHGSRNQGLEMGVASFTINYP